MPQMAFEYLEIRHCIFEVDGEIHSFPDDGEFASVRAPLASDDARFTIAWTLYGRYTDEAGESLAMAIGNFAEKKDASLWTRFSRLSRRLATSCSTQAEISNSTIPASAVHS